MLIRIQGNKGWGAKACCGTKLYRLRALPTAQSLLKSAKRGRVANEVTVLCKIGRRFAHRIGYTQPASTA